MTRFTNYDGNCSGGQGFVVEGTIFAMGALLMALIGGVLWVLFGNTKRAIPFIPTSDAQDSAKGLTANPFKALTLATLFTALGRAPQTIDLSKVPEVPPCTEGEARQILADLKIDVGKDFGANWEKLAKAEEERRKASAAQPSTTVDADSIGKSIGKAMKSLADRIESGIAAAIKASVPAPAPAPAPATTPAPAPTPAHP